MTGTGLIITVAQVLFAAFGVEYDPESLAAAANGLVTFIGFILVVWGQLRRKDLKFGLFRK